MKLNFCSLSSGSSGNCYYLGNEFHGILIDAGISATSIRKFLKNMDISMQTIMGVLITHNHIDHIKGLEVVTRKNSLPAFTTRTIWKSILTPQKKISRDCIREIPLKQKFHLADNISDNLNIICLAHLSKNNNTPEMVLQTLQQTFSERGIILNDQQRISILNRDMPTDVIRLVE